MGPTYDNFVEFDFIHVNEMAYRSLVQNKKKIKD